MKKELIQSVKSVQKGDKEKFAPLYEEFKQPIYFRAVNIVGEAEAENIVQETFITAFQRIRDLTNPETFPSWLNKIALGKCADFLKKQDPKPEPDNADFAEPDGLVPDNVGPETARIVYEVIQQLPLPQRACVYFYYYERLTIAEIAEELAADEDAVKARLAAAREAIQKALEEQDDDGLTLYLASPLLLIPIMKIAAQNTALPSILAGTTATTIISTAGTASTVTASTAGTAATATSSTAGTAGTAATATKAAFSVKAVIAAVLGAVVVTGGIIAAVVLANPETEPTIAEEETLNEADEDIETPDTKNMSGESATAQFDKHSYMLYNEVATSWEEAELFCENLGGHLATISSQEENDFLYEYITSLETYSSYFGLVKTNDSWTWVTGEPLNFINWAQGEPGTDEMYGMFYWKFLDGKWNDGDFGKGTDSGGTAFICEWDYENSAPPIITTAASTTAAAQAVTLELDFSKQGITDEKLAEMVADGTIPKNITKLHLWENQISDISPLKGLNNLTNLNLNDNQISDLSPLSNLTELTSLHLNKNKISDLSPISGLTNLTMLEIDDSQISDISPIAGLTNLTYLNLGYNEISDLSPLSGLTNLTFLGFDSNQIGDISILSKLTKLTFLNINSSAEDITPLRGLPLTSLYMSCSATDISAIGELTDLTHLRLYGLYSDISPLSSLINLEYLSLGGVMSNGQPESDISDATALSNLTKLKELSLWGTNINDISLLKGLTNLTSLSLTDNLFTEAQIAELQSALPNCVIYYNYD